MTGTVPPDGPRNHPPRRDLSLRAIALIVAACAVIAITTPLTIFAYQKSRTTSVDAGYEACQEAASAKLGGPATYSGFAYYQGLNPDEIRGKVAVTNARGIPVWTDVECSVEKTSNGWKILYVTVEAP